MRHQWLLMMALLMGLESAWAQGPGQPMQRPTVSPYINLARPGVNPGIEYYGIIRPELNLRNSLNQLQGQVNVNSAMIQQQSAIMSGEWTTGHDIHFRNYSHYFPGFGGPGGLVRPPQRGR